MIGNSYIEWRQNPMKRFFENPHFSLYAAMWAAFFGMLSLGAYMVYGLTYLMITILTMDTPPAWINTRAVDCIGRAFEMFLASGVWYLFYRLKPCHKEASSS